MTFQNQPIPFQNKVLIFTYLFFMLTLNNLHSWFWFCPVEQPKFSLFYVTVTKILECKYYIFFLHIFFPRLGVRSKITFRSALWESECVDFIYIWLWAIMVSLYSLHSKMWHFSHFQIFTSIFSKALLTTWAPSDIPTKINFSVSFSSCFSSSSQQITKDLSCTLC